MKRLFLIIFIFITSISTYAHSIVTSDANVTSTFPSWRFSMQGGYAYRVGKVDKSQDAVLVDHIKKLKHGVTYGADATWFFMESLGVGLKYNALHVGNSEHVTLTCGDGIQQCLLEDKINIWFFGPIASYRALSGNMRNAFFINVGLGYMEYKDCAALIDPFIIKGGTMGYLYEIGYDLSITDRISLGAMMSFVSGTVTGYKTNQGESWNTVDLESDSYESLNHLNLSIGLRINL